jgi:hypothetical protein
MTRTKSAAPRRHVASTTILTRENSDRLILCPECGGKNGLERLNQPCDFCGFMLMVRLFPDHSRYVRGLGVTKSGRDTYDIGDSVADGLRELSVPNVLTETAKALAQHPIEIGLSVKIGRQFKAAGFSWTKTGIRTWLKKRYEDRNPGMIRMNCGNILRGATKRSDVE